MDNILVTGGAGFIGSNLCRTLFAYGKTKITSLDNYSTGRLENHVDGVKYIKGDTSDISWQISESPDIIFHFGEFSRLEQSFGDIEKVWNANLGSLLEVLQFARKHNSKLIYSCSSSVLHSSSLSPYTWMKFAAADLIRNYSQWFGLRYVITYFYNVYGKGEIPRGYMAPITSVFRQRMFEGLSLPVVAPGTQRRNFTSVNDIVAGLKMLMDNSVEGDGYGMAHPESYSIYELASLYGGKCELIEPRAGNRMTNVVSNDKMYSLGWRPKESIETYIKQLKQNDWKEL